MDEIFGRRKDAPEAAAASAEDTAQAAAMVPPEQKTSSESLTEYFARKRAAMGLGPSDGAAIGAAATSAPAQGFSLDDQAAFAELTLTLTLTLTPPSPSPSPSPSP